MKRLVLAVVGVVAAGAVALVAAYSGSANSAAPLAINPGSAPAGCVLSIDPASLTRAAASSALAKYSKAQLANAGVVIARGTAAHVSARGLIVGLITALQESRLRNLANLHVPASIAYPHDDIGADADSLGVFQQRPSQGWGTVAQLMNPTVAADTFYRRLVQVPGWESMPPTVAAQTVQGSAFPDAYAAWTTVAAQLLSTLGNTAGSAVTGCQNNPTTPANGTVGARIVAAAQAQIGLPYVFDAGDAHGPTKALGGCDQVAIGGCDAVGFDCSGLSLYAWAQVGISLDHYAATQYGQGKQVPVDQAQPGDLLFYATNTGDIASIHHVTVFAGDGQMIEAPQSGERVHQTPVRHDGELMPMAVQPVAR